MTAIRRRLHKSSNRPWRLSGGPGTPGPNSPGPTAGDGRAPKPSSPRERRAEGHSHLEDEPRELTPRQIVGELDKYVIGQKAAKRAVGIALRNRWRRSG